MVVSYSGITRWYYTVGITKTLWGYPKLGHPWEGPPLVPNLTHYPAGSECSTHFQLFVICTYFEMFLTFQFRQWHKEARLQRLLWGISASEVMVLSRNKHAKIHSLATSASLLENHRNRDSSLQGSRSF